MIRKAIGRAPRVSPVQSIFCVSSSSRRFSCPSALLASYCASSLPCSFVPPILANSIINTNKEPFSCIMKELLALAIAAAALLAIRPVFLIHLLLCLSRTVNANSTEVCLILDISQAIAYEVVIRATPAFVIVFLSGEQLCSDPR
jgi:hypothetical protein